MIMNDEPLPDPEGPPPKPAQAKPLPRSQRQIDSERFVRFMQQFKALDDALHDLNEQTKGTNILLLKLIEQGKDNSNALLSELRELRQVDLREIRGELNGIRHEIARPR